MGNSTSKSWEKIARSASPWILSKLGETGKQHLQILKFYTFLIMAGIGWRKRTRNENKDIINRPQIAAVVKAQTNSFRHRMDRWRSFLNTDWGGRKSASDILHAENPGRQKSKLADTHRESYKDISIKEYENRLRLYSRPEKIFAYFATIKTKNEADEWEIFMTPIDFLRAVMPGLRQPEGLGLKKFRKISREKAANISFKIVPKDTIFYELRPNGLLSYGDYLYLWMILKMPKRNFTIGFNLFDKMGNQRLNRECMSHILLSRSSDERYKIHSSVNRYLFGPSGKNTISLENFLEFKRKLNNDVLQIEFNLLLQTDVDEKGNQKFDNKISEFAFAERILTYSLQSTSEKIINLRRIKKKYRRHEEGITLSEFMTFHKFLQNLSIIDSALDFHYLSGADVNLFTLKHTSQIVLGRPLSPHILKIIYTLFDKNNDGVLSREDFIGMMRPHISHYGKKTWHLHGLFKAIWKCALNS